MDILVDFMSHLGLLTDGYRYLAGHLHHLRKILPDFIKHGTHGTGILHGTGRHLTAVLHGGHRLVDLLQKIIDDGFDVAGGILGALRQGAHFIRHHRKAPPLLASAGGLDGGIQRQQIGLGSDGFNLVNDLGDFLAVLGQFIDGGAGKLNIIGQGTHLLQGSTHLLTATLRFATGGGYRILGALGVIRHPLHGVGQLADGRRHLLGSIRLRLHTGTAVLRVPTHVFRQVHHFIGTGRYLGNQLAYPLSAEIKAHNKAPHFIIAALLKTHGHIPFRHACSTTAHLLDGIVQGHIKRRVGVGGQQQEKHQPHHQLHGTVHHSLFFGGNVLLGQRQ